MRARATSTPLCLAAPCSGTAAGSGDTGSGAPVRAQRQGQPQRVGTERAPRAPQPPHGSAGPARGPGVQETRPRAPAAGSGERSPQCGTRLSLPCCQGTAGLGDSPRCPAWPPPRDVPSYPPSPHREAQLQRRQLCSARPLQPPALAAWVPTRISLRLEVGEAPCWGCSCNSGARWQPRRAPRGPSACAGGCWRKGGVCACLSAPDGPE